jgi:oxalate decarboxylase/phosphoglucose isomerase-like protein (cupin superfamily)
VGLNYFLPDGRAWQCVVFVPANEVHQMKNTGEELLVVVCLIPASAPEI